MYMILKKELKNILKTKIKKEMILKIILFKIIILGILSLLNYKKLLFNILYKKPYVLSQLFFLFLTRKYMAL